MSTRPPITVRGVKTNDESVVRVYKSLYGAKHALLTEFGIKADHSTIKRCADANRPAYGFKWEIVDEPAQAQPVRDTEAPAVVPGDVFMFRECVESIFNDCRVRVTDIHWS
jgi:hypothetical protein